MQQLQQLIKASSDTSFLQSLQILCNYLAQSSVRAWRRPHCTRNDWFNILVQQLEAGNGGSWTQLSFDASQNLGRIEQLQTLHKGL